SAAPDGHTLLVGQPAEVAINQHWIRGLGYDPINDLQPVALATVVPLALVIPAAAPYATVTDMLQASKARGLSFASAGTGTPGHFAGGEPIFITSPERAAAVVLRARRELSFTVLASPGHGRQ